MGFTSIRSVATAQLHNGDRMTRLEFHQLYEQSPEELKAELVRGVVYIAAPPDVQHQTAHAWLSAVLLAYQTATPGVELFDNATLQLDDRSEPQPDLFLRIHPECGGLSGNSNDGYVIGAPELIVEVAQSAKSIDLHYKRHDYARCRVPEYLVYVVEEQRLRWFYPKDARERRPTRDGILRIKQFPGLWIDQAALIAQDQSALVATLQRGLATQDHADFARQLMSVKM
jgi:Uma2 family endonuclease